MRRPPRKPSEGIFNPQMTRQVLLSALLMAVLSFLFWIYLIKNQVAASQARNMVLLLMVLFENVHIFNCRSESVSAFRIPLRRNLLLVASIFLALGLHLLCMNTPFMQEVLQVSPVSVGQLSITLLAALMLLPVMESYKLLGNYLQRRHDR